MSAGEDDNLPKLKAYDKNLFFKVNIQDLLINILFVVFSFFISEEFFSGNEIFFELKPWQTTGLYCAVTLTVPYYLGYLYVRTSAYYSKVVMRIYLWVFIIMTLMILVYLMRLIFMMGEVNGVGRNASGFMALFGVFLLVLGPMMCLGGATMATGEFTRENKKEPEFDIYDATPTGALFIIVLAIAFMIFFMGLFPEGSGGWIVIVAYLGGPIAAMLVYGLFLGFMSWLSKMGVYKYLALFAKNTFPFFIICILVFWSGVAIHFMIHDFGSAAGKLSWGAIIFSVGVSGLIPFRIISMLNPPLKMSNIVIGTATLIYFFWKMATLAM